MRIAALAVFCSVICAMTGCRSISAMGEGFKTASRTYNELLRWQEMDKACAALVDKPLREECEKRAAVAKDAKVVDYRVKWSEFNGERGEAEATVEFDYYALPSARVKTIEDQQKWRYLEENGNAEWRLISLPPEFR